MQTSARIEQYRALCLLALKRQPEAEQAIEALVAVDPFYRPGEADAAPWVRASFSDVRRRLLPQMAQRHFVDARPSSAPRSSGRRRRSSTAFSRCSRTRTWRPIEANPALSDLRTLAEGFLELSQNALAKEVLADAFGGSGAADCRAEAAGAPAGATAAGGAARARPPVAAVVLPGASTRGDAN